MALAHRLLTKSHAIFLPLLPPAMVAIVCDGDDCGIWRVLSFHVTFKEKWFLL